MTRPSPFVIMLSDADRAELQRRARCYTAPHAELLRAKIVLLAAEGTENTVIAARLDVHVGVVSRWRGRFAEEGIDGLADRKRSGRPRVFAATVVAQVKAMACEPPEDRDVPQSRWSAADLAARAVQEGLVESVSRSTVRRWLEKDAIAPFTALVNQVMTAEPYASARRVFWIADNGSSHRGQASIDRMTAAWPNAVLVHLPVHASWLNQVEVVFSVIQRKVIKPADAGDRDALAARLLAFAGRYNTTARPFDWKFTRAGLNDLCRRIEARRAASPPVAA